MTEAQGQLHEVDMLVTEMKQMEQAINGYRDRLYAMADQARQWGAWQRASYIGDAASALGTAQGLLEMVAEELKDDVVAEMLSPSAPALPLNAAQARYEAAVKAAAQAIESGGVGAVTKEMAAEVAAAHDALERAQYEARET